MWFSFNSYFYISRSRLDGFSCKVTLDIITTGYDNTERITEILRDHIRNRALLGNSTVKDDDFSATVIDPGKLMIHYLVLYILLVGKKPL